MMCLPKYNKNRLDETWSILSVSDFLSPRFFIPYKSLCDWYLFHLHRWLWTFNNVVEHLLKKSNRDILFFLFLPMYFFIICLIESIIWNNCRVILKMCFLTKFYRRKNNGDPHRNNCTLATDVVYYNFS